ncbi:MAG: VWA domain-containing protein [Blastocatellia bacterium]|nr:VWA domain-containing protein [Blastocatellia bacterium]MCX7752290.1 VWA domain-containing protein [Blastocatellia bacterium]MDW8167782.1 VWA domain-containing protein [Acidobacteriota bacterium]
MRCGKWHVLLLLLVFGSAWAQSGRRLPVEKPKETKEPDEAAVTLETTEVVVPVTVRDRYGRLIRGLSRYDFTLYEDGVRQEITDFTVGTVPVNVVLLIDISGSVATEINDIRLAALAFLNALGPKDRVAIIRFNHKVEEVLDWETDKLRLQRALFQLPAVGNTAFYKALYVAANKLKAVEGRRAILLFTDGVDTYDGPDQKTFDEALEAVRRAEAIVYVISKTKAIRAFLKGERSPFILRPLDPNDFYVRLYLQVLDQAEEQLIALAEKTGGRIYFPLEQSELKEAYAQIAEELSTQYILRYMPKNTTRDGRFRRIRVMTGNPAYIAIAREGYYAPNQ